MSEVGHHSPGDSSRLVFTSITQSAIKQQNSPTVFSAMITDKSQPKKKERKKETSLQGGTESVENNYRLPARPGWSSEVKKAQGLAHQL